jgi:hypothetical protein
MPRIFHKLPFYDPPTSVTVAGERVAVKPDQIIVWVSLGEPGQAVPGPQVLRLPVVLDTGLAHNFGIREEHLSQWAGLYPPLLYPPLLPTQGHIRLGGLHATVVSASVWLYPNRPGERDTLLDGSPFRLETLPGIAVYPRGTAGAPRLPVLGLRALRRSKLHLTVDGDRCLVYLRTPRRFWFFG